MDAEEWEGYLHFEQACLADGRQCGRETLSEKFGFGGTKAKSIAFALKNKDIISGDIGLIPANHIAGKTTRHIKYKDGDGKMVEEWIRSSPQGDALNRLLTVMVSRTPILSKKISPPKNPNKDLMLEWLLMDHHLGMHSWAKETGADYDIKLAGKLIISAASKIFTSHGHVGKAVIVLGGDNQHADNRSAVTERAGHKLDVDSRYPKALDAMYLSMCTTIDIALANADEVEVVVLSGNHDYHSAIALSRILAAHYRKQDRLHIHTDPAKHKFVRFGSTQFMYTHGDTGGPIRPATYLLNWIIEHNQTGIKRKLVRKGHLHKRGQTIPPGLTEESGVTVELFPTLAAPDAWAHEECYSQQRATIANLFHKEYGLRSRMELGVSELLESEVTT